MTVKPIGRALRPAALVPLVTALAGCLNAHYQPFSLKYTESGIVSLDEGLIEVSDSFSLPQRAAIVDAYRRVVEVIRDKRFQEIVSAPPFERLATAPSEECEWIPPSEIARAVSAYVDQQEPLRVLRSANVGKWHVWGVTATTETCSGTTTFGGVVEQWEDSGKRGKLINTVAHEMTHLLPVPDKSSEFTCGGDSSKPRIRDDGHVSCSLDRKQCDDAFLASYAFGDLVQCFHEAAATCPSQKVDVLRCQVIACYEKTINAVKTDSLVRSGLTPTDALARCGAREVLPAPAVVPSQCPKIGRDVPPPPPPPCP